jgi:nicotinamidase/pyrazinamidase
MGAAAVKNVTLLPGDALVVADLQYDFLPGGTLAVPHSDEVVPVLNSYLTAFSTHGLPIYATRDWHPANHCSFKAQGGPWPVHCVAETYGAQFAGSVRFPAGTVVISKATQPDREAYSAFEGTDLNARLRAQNIKRAFVGGLATDYCVVNTVRDARAHGYEVYVLSDAIRAVNLMPDDGRKAEEEMQRLGAISITLNILSA